MKAFKLIGVDYITNDSVTFNISDPRGDMCGYAIVRYDEVSDFISHWKGALEWRSGLAPNSILTQHAANPTQ